MRKTMVAQLVLDEPDNSLLNHIEVVMHVSKLVNLVVLVIAVKEMRIGLLLKECLVPGDDLEDGPTDITLTLELDFAASARNVATEQSWDASLCHIVVGTVIGTIAISCLPLLARLLDVLLYGR